jgi:3'-phosphoadenosine 5'-phosphosulfate sulfotransferase (PAPS reductase)/FAD synthetase
MGEQIDDIVFADTGFEFPELYEYINRVEDYIGKKVKVLQPNKDFHEWFNGEITRGEHKGHIRGFPMEILPCWWTREAKMIPLQKYQKDFDKVYVGIAYDEKERMSTTDHNLFYPLVEWKWTEQDCVNYLNERSMLNPLYVNFNRLGCWFCPKQGVGALYVLWKNYPSLWERLKWWDKEQYNVWGRYIKSSSIESFEDMFNRGELPQDLPKYDCWQGCESVKRAYKSRQMVLGQC